MGIAETSGRHEGTHQNISGRIHTKGAIRNVEASGASVGRSAERPTDRVVPRGGSGLHLT
ncbi:hypothetical protein AMK22_27320 [Streptomyces sp. CB01580]|nr:hypothetical protein AMK22_27320 [Streptomyces sp. CB01580]